MYTPKGTVSIQCSRNSVRMNIGGVIGAAMVLGKLPEPGRLTYLDNSRARAYCPCSRCGWGLFGHFFFQLSSPLSSSV